MDARLLAALAEPNRLRIVVLLGAAPRAVGEIAATLDLRQPQVTKHLQALSAAGLVTVHPLGQRRVYALAREPLRELRAWLGTLERDHPSDGALVEYERAIAAERARAEHPARAPGTRALRLVRDLPATPPAVWHAWTTAGSVRRWWSPEHFTVADCEVDPVVGGRLRVVLAEGDGTRHQASGRFLALVAPRALTFELAPLDAGGTPLFSALHEVRIARRGAGSRLSMAARVSHPRPEATPALAGMELGWRQTLDKLAAHLAGG